MLLLGNWGQQMDIETRERRLKNFAKIGCRAAQETQTLKSGYSAKKREW
jgi:hypothetical protein